MKFLVDANVLSESTKPTPDPLVDKWLFLHERELAINPIILGELRYGVLRMPVSAKRKALQTWFEEGISRIHCLPWDADSGLRWAELLAHLQRIGKPMPIKDSLIATTALVHNLTVVTRNEIDFAHCNVRVLNPFAK